MVALSKTAALVMRWAKRHYGDGGPGKYVEALDLTSADALFDVCDRVCPWYEEVILDRKHLIREWAKEWLSVSGNDQVVILAAGMAPLSMELLEGRSNSRIIEVDVDGMSQKKSIYSEIVPDLANRIEFLDLDICSESLIESICSRVRWFEPHRPTLLIMEGISYYLPEERLRRIVSGFAHSRLNGLILEYLVPDGDVEEERRHIPNEVFRAIADDASLTSLARYSHVDVRSLVRDAGGSVLMDVPLSYMESLRKGHQEHFASDGSGWIRCASIRL